MHFPGLYCRACFVVDDGGEGVLRYRRLVSMFAPTPHDVWDRWLEPYTPGEVFPVVDTPLGRRMAWVVSANSAGIAKLDFPAPAATA